MIILALTFLSSYLVDAKPILRKTDKGPYGTYVLYDQLPQLLPNSSFTINYSSPVGKLKNSYEKEVGYITIAPYIDYKKEDLEAFDHFLEQGNVLVLSGFLFGDEIKKWLNLDIGLTFSMKGSDSIRIFDMDSAAYDQFHSGKFFQSYISKYDSAATDMQILGKYNNGSINFICFKKANGYVVVQTQPYMFSNYHLIKKKTKAYTEVFFSSLPGPISSVIWDEYAKTSDEFSDFSGLGFIMKQPPLRNAFWWSLAGLFLVVLFSFKRRQRIIPVLSPLINNSLDMVRTVSDMYFFSHRNEVMAKKKIAHWLEFLRVKYNIFTTLSPDAFWQTVQMRSSISDEQMQKLRTMVERYRNGDERISDTELIHLNYLIDSFYKA